MADGDKQTQKQIFRKETEDRNLQGNDIVPGTFLQSFWIRCRTIFPDITNGKFMESELRYVLYCGIIIWFAYLLSQVLK